MPVPPPRLDSAEYAAAYNEVYDLGDRFSPFRTEDQTEIGLFWAYDRAGPGHAGRAVQPGAPDDRGRQQGNTMSENARLFATANVAMADAGIVTWACKYLDNFWRPITGIRSGDLDGNPDTVADTEWEPLGAPTNSATASPPRSPPTSPATAPSAPPCSARSQNFYGTDAVPFTLTSDETPGVTRSYTSFTQAAEENGDSRIYLGVHWRFDDTYGQHVRPRDRRPRVRQRVHADTVNVAHEASSPRSACTHGGSGGTPPESEATAGAWIRRSHIECVTPAAAVVLTSTCVHVESGGVPPYMGWKPMPRVRCLTSSSRTPAGTAAPSARPGP